MEGNPIYYSYLCGMKTIGNHIEELLQWHDCVVVPGVGGFLTNYREADIEMEGEEECSVFPPMREIRFNQSLVDNDGVLVHAYMRAYDTSYPSAERQMRVEIADMLDFLSVDGQYTVGHIGILHQDIYGNLSFRISEIGVASPYLYGLPAFSADTLAAVRHQQEVMNTLSETSLSPIERMGQAREDAAEKGDFIVRIGRRWIDFAVSAVAAVMLFFVMAIPTMRHQQGESTDVVSASVSPAVTFSEKAASKSTDKAPEQSPKAAAMQEKDFSIVMACYVTRENAEYFLANLKKEGLNEGRYVKTGRKSWIMYSNYETKEAANAALSTLRKQSKSFAEAWVIKSR